MRRATSRCDCQGIGTPKVLGEMISREASVMAVARLALEICELGSSRARLKEGKIS